MALFLGTSALNSAAHQLYVNSPWPAGGPCSLADTYSSDSMKSAGPLALGDVQFILARRHGGRPKTKLSGCTAADPDEAAGLSPLCMDRITAY